MIHNFENITKEQLKVLTDAITWITILIVTCINLMLIQSKLLIAE